MQEFAVIGNKIRQALVNAESLCGVAFRVHLSRRWIDFDPSWKAKFFLSHWVREVPRGEKIVLYLNLNKNRFGIAVTEHVQKTFNERTLNLLAKSLQDELHATHFENAVALTICTMAVSLEHALPNTLGPER